ncbi:MAG: hypothetical protein DMG56_26490 [Acidobacteria bacterium]|nr:MAG: hypothetical protein DMG56_26490 [Acidobacteriota bacterium]
MLRDRAHRPSHVRPASVMMVAALVCGTPGELLGAQAERKMSEGSSSPARIERGVDLASKGKCPEALTILRESIPAPVDKQLRYRAAMARAQCGMSVDQADVVVESLLLLNHEFPDDSKVLYITSRYYSELANRAARKLTVKAPSSAEAQVLMAEAYQARGDFESATAKYRRILEQYPKQPGVHYQLGQIILAKIPTASEEARREFEAELQVNPTSPAAEYMLGDLAWRAMNSDEAMSGAALPWARGGAQRGGQVYGGDRCSQEICPANPCGPRRILSTCYRLLTDWKPAGSRETEDSPARCRGKVETGFGIHPGRATAALKADGPSGQLNLVTAG